MELEAAGLLQVREHREQRHALDRGRLRLDLLESARRLGLQPVSASSSRSGWADVDRERKLIAVRWRASGAGAGVSRGGPSGDQPLAARLDPAAPLGHLSAGVLARRMRRLSAARIGPAARPRLDGGARAAAQDEPAAALAAPASWWVQAGVPIAKVAKWLGNSPEVIQRHYGGLVAGWDPDAERGAAG